MADIAKLALLCVSGLALSLLIWPNVISPKVALGQSKNYNQKAQVYKPHLTSNIPRILKGHRTSVLDVGYSRDGRKLASGSSDKRIKVWDTNTWEELNSLAAHLDQVRCVSFGKESRYLYSGSFDKSIIMWDLTSSTALRRLHFHSPFAIQVGVSQDGSQIASGLFDLNDEDHDVVVWDAKTGKEKFRLNANDNGTLAVCFSPNGKYLAGGGIRGSITVWDLSTKRKSTILQAHQDRILSVDFDPDSKLLVSASVDGTARIWNITSGKEIVKFEGHARRVFCARFSPNGAFVLSCGCFKEASGTSFCDIRIWKSSSGEEVLRVGEDTGPIFRAIFSPSGQHIAAGCGDGTVRVWTLKYPEKESRRVDHE